MNTNWERKNKYRNIKATIDGITFDSRAEMHRYCELKLMERAHEISDLDLQTVFVLQPAFRDKSGKLQREITYRADFTYTDNRTGEYVIEDVKSEATRRDKVYVLKRKIMAYQGNEITEV